MSVDNSKIYGGESPPYSFNLTSKIMEKNIFKFLTVAVIPLFLACKKEVNTSNSIQFSEKDLPEAVNLEGYKYSFSQIINPRGLLVVDSKALIFENKNANDNKFHIIDLKTESYIQSKGIDGLGPGEITVISQIEALDQPNKIFTYDPELIVFSIFDLLDTNRLSEKQFRAPETAFFITDATFTSDTSFLGNAVDGWTKYLHLTVSGDTLALFGNWRDMVRGKTLPNGIKEDELDPNLISSVFQGPMKVNSRREFAVKAGINVDYFDIVNLREMSVLTVFGPTPDLPNFKTAMSAGYQMPSYQVSPSIRYIDVFAGENSFFCLLLGKTYEEISLTEHVNRIFEFSYKGNLLNQYLLDYPLIGFSVDEENRRFYGVTIDEEPNLVRFDY